MRLASLIAIFISERSSLLLCIIGISLSIATFFAVILSPKDFSTDTLGPMKMIPLSSQLCANLAFSDKKPYPG